MAGTELPEAVLQQLPIATYPWHSAFVQPPYQPTSHIACIQERFMG